MAWNVTVKDFMLSLVTPFHHLDPPFYSENVSLSVKF